MEWALENLHNLSFFDTLLKIFIVSLDRTADGRTLRWFYFSLILGEFRRMPMEYFSKWSFWEFLSLRTLVNVADNRIWSLLDLGKDFRNINPLHTHEENYQSGKKPD
jgi:hypothetical protein